MKQILAVNSKGDAKASTSYSPSKPDRVETFNFLARILIVDTVFREHCLEAEGPAPPLHLRAKVLYTSCEVCYRSSQISLF